MPAVAACRTASKMATDNLSDEQIRRLRLLSVDNVGIAEPRDSDGVSLSVVEGDDYMEIPPSTRWYTDRQLDDFFVMENCDLEQTAALAMESRAGMLQVGMGGFSSQGVTVNAAAMAQGLLTQADRLRQSYRRA